MPRVLTAILIVSLCASSVIAQEKKKKQPVRGFPKQITGAEVEVYKTVGDVKLNIYIFTPKDHKASSKRPAIVFFFGGGWRGGNPTQFQQQCRYLASRGMVAMTADYRVSSRHGTKAKECVADAKSAVRWIRANAARLGVDPHRVAAGGGSAGGHIAACTGTVVKGFDESSEDEKISSVPDAMVLFNPALVLADVNGRLPFDQERMSGMKDRCGVEPVEISPYHHVKKGAPPTIVLHGKGDTTVAYWTAEVFATAMTKAGNRCVLAGYEDQKHGFFNYGRGDGSQYVKTARAMDEFLISLGYLNGKPTITLDK